MHYTTGSVGCAALALLVVVAATASAVPSSSDSAEELATVRSCKELCGSCGCLGFYCGEECLCECDANGDDEHDAKCIERMQDRCESERMPFEVLIQGSTGNRLVRSLFADAAADEAGVCIVKDPAMRKKRNTFSIYKPAAAAVAVADEVASKLVEQHRERRLAGDNAETLREVQSFLSEIGAELESELMQREERNAQPLNSHEKRGLRRRELQENERFVVRKRDTVDEGTTAEDVIVVVDEATTVAAETSVEVVTTDAVTADGEVLGVVQNQLPAITTPQTITTIVAPVVPPVSPKQQMKQKLAAALEQLKSKLVAADGDQLTAIRARKEEVKAKMLADLEAKKQRITEKAAAAKQQFEEAKERSAQKAADFQAQVRNKLNVAPSVVVQPIDGSAAAVAPNGDAVVGAALPVGFGALQPALHKLRSLLTPGGTAAGNGPNVGLARPQPGLGGLTAKQQQAKQQLRQKLLAKPGGLAAWARTLGSANPIGDADDLGAEEWTTVAEVSETSQAAVTQSAGIVVEPVELVDE